MGVENPQLSCHLYLTRTLSMAIVPYLDGPRAIIHGGTQQLWVPPGDGGKVHLEETYVGTISFIMSDIDVGGPLSVHRQQEGQRSDGPLTIAADHLA